MSPVTPQPDGTGSLEWAAKIHTPSQALVTEETAVAAARSRVDALIQIDPDDRLNFLNSAEWGFNTDHITQVNRIVDEFLDTIAKREIRRIAAQLLDAEKPPQAIVDQWFTEKECDRLIGSLDNTDVPDRMMVACYAWLEVHEAALAARLLHMHRSRPRPDFSGFSQTPEERDEDLRSVNAV